MKSRPGKSLKFAPGLWLGAAVICGVSLVPAGAAPLIGAVRVFTTEPACFEYLFTGATRDAAGGLLLAFNHRNGRTAFVRPGEYLGSFRVADYLAGTNRVYHPTLNATLDEPAGKATLAGPGGETIVLEQNRRLPRPGRVAWLVGLDSGIWWSVQEQDVFFMGDQPVFVEEIDEDGVTVTAGRDLVFVRRLSAGEQDALDRLWADRKRQEQQRQELALQRRREEAARAEAAAVAAAASTPAYYPDAGGTRVEIRQPARFFYGCEYRFPTAFKGYSTFHYVNGKPVGSYIVLPSRFETRYSGTMLIGP